MVFQELHQHDVMFPVGRDSPGADQCNVLLAISGIHVTVTVTLGGGKTSISNSIVNYANVNIHDVESVKEISVTT